MSDAPLVFAGGAGSPDAAVPTTMMSLWQSNCSAARVERWWSAARLVDSAIAVVEGSW
jgi:hypothetical protein